MTLDQIIASLRNGERIAFYKSERTLEVSLQSGPIENDDRRLVLNQSISDTEIALAKFDIVSLHIENALPQIRPGGNRVGVALFSDS